MGRSRLHSLILVAMFLFVAHCAHAATYYVAKNGNNGYNGSEASPWLTIAYGISRLAAGDTLIVKAGTYVEVELNGTTVATSASPVTIKANPGDTVTIRPNAGVNRVFTFTGASYDYNIIDGFILDGVNVGYDVVKITSGANHITIKNCEIMNSPNNHGVLISGAGSDYNTIQNCSIHNNGSTGLDHGVYVQTQYNVIENCTIHDNAGYGIHGYDDPNYCTIRKNTIYNHPNAAAVILTGVYNVVYDNLFYDNYQGIRDCYGGDHNSYYNNTVTQNTVGISIESDSTYATVKNNIAYGNTTNTNFVSGTLTESYNMTTAPSFVDGTNHDFHLQSGSGAIDTGTTIASVPDDFDGITRPFNGTYDKGAYEFRYSTYYVATNGNNANPGTEAQPWRDINYGVSHVAAGDTLIVKAGTYNEKVKDFVSGTASQPTTVRVNTGDTVTLANSSGADLGQIFLTASSKSYIVIDGFICDGVNQSSQPLVQISGGANHITLKNLEVKNGNNGSGDYGIFIENDSHYNTLTNVKSHNNGTGQYNHGVRIRGNYNVVTGAQLYSNGGDGIRLEGDYNTITKSRIYANTKNGITMYTGADNNLISNNVLYENLYYGDIIFTPYSGSVYSNKVYNNTCYNSSYGILMYSSSNGTIVKNNICYEATWGNIYNAGTSTVLSNNLSDGTDPNFVNAAGKDFHLACNSPAIDAGTTLAEVVDDYDGIARPYNAIYDEGAYEYH